MITIEELLGIIQKVLVPGFERIPGKLLRNMFRLNRHGRATGVLQLRKTIEYTSHLSQPRRRRDRDVTSTNHQPVRLCYAPLTPL
jgi:hypothetical protein